ncbi:chromosome condensation protein CrcB [Haemophilus influenzae]|nr:chromosome condensation protein CrcB [Haemophilus influenzae]
MPSLLEGEGARRAEGDIGICEIKFWNDEILKKDNVPKTIYVEIEHLSPLSLRQLPPINGWSQDN